MLVGVVEEGGAHRLSLSRLTDDAAEGAGAEVGGAEELDFLLGLELGGHCVCPRLVA